MVIDRMRLLESLRFLQCRSKLELVFVRQNLKVYIVDSGIDLKIDISVLFEKLKNRPEKSPNRCSDFWEEPPSGTCGVQSHFEGA